MVCIPLKIYEKYANLAMVVGIISLALLPLLGVEINDAKSWYDLKIFNLQPSEFMKIITILWMACYYERKRKIRVFFKQFGVGLWVKLFGD
jgi:cell division protein FtsW